MLDVVKHGNEHLLLRNAYRGIIIVVVCTIVNDTVHVQVEVIEFRYPIFCDELGDGRISLAHPSEEFGDTHSSGEGIAATAFPRWARYVEGEEGRFAITAKAVALEMRHTGTVLQEASCINKDAYGLQIQGGRRRGLRCCGSDEVEVEFSSFGKP